MVEKFPMTKAESRQQYGRRWPEQEKGMKQKRICVLEENSRLKFRVVPVNFLQQFYKVFHAITLIT